MERTIYDIWNDANKKLSDNDIKFEKQLKDKFLGKRVFIKNGISGIVNFIGYNRYLHNTPQVTIGRTPVYPVNFDDIVLIDDVSDDNILNTITNLTENPDRVKDNNVELYWKSPDSYVFGYIDDDIYINYSDYHFTLGDWKPELSSRKEYVYPGRMWINHKIISF